jgi:hypothetical protein
MNLKIIQEKIKDGEGYLEVETLDIISAKQYDELTDPKFDLIIEDYQEQIDKIKNGENINIVRNNELKKEIEDLDLLGYGYQQEYKSQEIQYLILQLDVARDEFLEIKEQNAMFQKKMEIKKLEKEINFKQQLIANKIRKNKNEIIKKQNEIDENNKNIELQMQEISNDLMAKRKPQNLDYLYYQGLKIIKQFTKHDYKIVDDELVLLTDVEKLDIAKEKKVKEIANRLNNLYPEKLIDGTLVEFYNGKKVEIDSLSTIEEINLYKI